MEGSKELFRRLLIMLIVAIIAARNVYELDLQCPHTVNFGETTMQGMLTLPGLALTEALALELESSCSMDVHNSLKTNTEVTEIQWSKKADHTGSASSTSFEAKESQKNLNGLCVLGHKVVEQAYKLRKSVICYDLICNQTACKPELHFVSPVHACTMMKSCIVALGPYRIQVNFRKNFCSTGILVEGRCFRPDKTLVQSVKVGMIEVIHLPAVCYLIARNSEDLKIMEEIEKLHTGGCSSNEHKFQGYYLCVAGGHSDLIRVPNEGDQRARQLFKAIANSPYGEDHDNVGESLGHMRIAGSLEVKVPHTESTANLEGIAFSGTPLYSSISVFTKEVTPKYVFSPGLLISYNQTKCNKKAMPLVWTGMVQITGVFEQINKCTVFCVLSGPGASCEAFAEGGIYNLSSPTCLVAKYNILKTNEQQISFVCQRIDTDIVVYCNGYKKVILTKTLVIGQCIYSVTSFFSIFSGIAHSIAIELCVPGFHGWATMALVVTFCAGWLLIPAITYIILVVLRCIANIMHTQAESSRFRVLLKKIKEEYEKTKGSMVCEVCKLECETQKELKAHNLSCPQSQCPYCFTHCEPSELAFQAHFQVCQVTHRFSDDLKKTVSATPQRQGFYRTLNVFRYKSRCYIFTVWIILLLLESMIWAATAEPEPLTPEWSDTAHGLGIHKLDTDLELDFSLMSSSRYTYRRKLQNPRNEEQLVGFHLEISQQTITAEVQQLGHWYDAEINVKTSFHCYGSCEKYKYPWQNAYCKHEQDFQYESGWGCNPIDCPGIGSGCTACGIYLDKLKAKGFAYKIISLKYTRKICIQMNEDTACKVVDANDCFVARNFKVCMVGTVSKFQPGDTLLFLGPMESGGLILKQWCSANCQYGDPGDIMKLPSAPYSCPEYSGQFRKKCVFAHTPVCEYQGNLVSGYKKLMATVDSFQSFNTTGIHFSKSRLEWSDPDGILRDHINVLVGRDMEFTDLAENPCKVSVQTLSIEGAWGSGVGFTLKCQASLTECPAFITSIKACDSAICYGATSVTLNRGQTVVLVTGRGGHSGSRFRCCHDTHCSTESMLASPPHLDRVMGVDVTADEHVYDDGAPPCRISCWFKKTGEWLWGLLQGNWMVVLALILLLSISLIALSFLCPVRKIKRG